MKKEKGANAFEEYYSHIYGQRWPSLKAAMMVEANKTALVNPFCESHPLLKKEYYIDPASIVVAQALEVRPGDKVLDLCSAPGGKALTILFDLRNEVIDLTVNELSSQRRARLHRVLDEYLPSELRVKIKVRGKDASSWCTIEQNAYDRILLDAPCSSEKHLLQNEKELKDWAPGRTKRLAAQQWAMLAGAILVLREGGRLVYSTCSISPLENDGVIEKCVNKFGNQIRVIRKNCVQGESTQFGQVFLPDQGPGGPMYLAIIERFAQQTDQF